MSRRLPALLVSIVTVALAAGCAMPSAQSTPFFGDDGASPDRVNMWPVFYHDGDATSALWPIGEHIRNERFLIWPLYSQEELGGGKRRYGAVGPLMAFNQETKNNRIVPVFWGKDYFVLFPLLWLCRDKASALVPLWMQFRDTKCISTHLLWPIFNVKTPPAGKSRDDHTEYGWRLWPAYGHYRKGTHSTHYWLWPFGRYTHDGDAVLRLFLPFYYGSQDTDGRLDIVPPVFLRQRTSDVSRLAILPLFFAEWAEQASKLWVFPSYWKSIAGQARTDAVFPFFYLFRDEDSHRLGIFPFVYRGRDGDTTFQWIFPTYFSEISPDSVTRVFLPFYFGHRSPDREGFGILPFYFRGRHGERTHTNIAGLLWDSVRDGTRHQWWAAMPFVNGLTDTNRRRYSVWPLYRRSTSGDDTRWDLLPFFPSAGDDPDEIFLSLMGRRTKPDYRSFWLGPYWQTRRSRHRHWTGGGRIWEADVDEKATHVLPLYRHYYSGPRPGTLKEPDMNPAGGDVRYPTTTVKDHLFPIWNSARERVVIGPQEGVRKSEFDLLLWLYNYERQIYVPRADTPDERIDKTHWQILWELVDYERSRPSQPDPSAIEDESQLRILWRVIYYQRQGDKVSLDALPGITYDSRPGEKKVFSFLWRVFRYDWNPDDGAKWHILFIPFGG